MKRLVRQSKSLIQSTFEKFGYRLRLVPLRKVFPQDVRNAGNDPRTLHYYTNDQVLLNAPIEKGYGLDHYSVNSDGSHPFVRAAMAGLNSGQPRNAIRSILREYYNNIQPLDAAEWMGFSAEELPNLAGVPPWGRVYPWRSTTVEAMKKGIRATADLDNAQGGRALSIEHGWRSFGPVSNDIIEIETNRIYNLVEAVQRHGIKRDDRPGGDVGAIALVNDDGDWRWLVEFGGEHRVPVFSALGYNEIPIRVRLVIYRKDVSLWPNVFNGLYSKYAALEVFDRYFSAEVPEIASDYLDAIDE